MTSQNRNYPTRMHEVLGVETGEIFTINENDYGFYHTLDCDGQIVFTDPEDEKEYRVTADMVTNAINHGITRKPRMSEEQVAQLRALVTLGFRWLAKDKWIISSHAYIAKPEKGQKYWLHNKDFSKGSEIPEYLEINDLVSWSDPEPLDIVATLKAAGGEGEG